MALEKLVTKEKAKSRINKLRDDIKRNNGRSKSGKKKKKGKKNPAEVFELIAKSNAYVLKGKLEKVEYDGTGRPTVMTQETVGKLEYAFAFDSTVEEACLYAGIHRDTYYAFIKENPDFSDRVADLREAAVMLLRQTVLKAAMYSSDLAMKYLERKRRVEFATRQEQAHSGEIVNKHSIDPKTATLIKNAMGNFAKKINSMADKKPNAQ